MTTKWFLYAGLLCLMVSCSEKKAEESADRLEESGYAAVAADTASMGDASSAPLAQEENVMKTDTARHFIRTADMKFKVKNVSFATYAIEDIVAKNGGFVTYTNLASNTYNTTTTKVSEDSTLESTSHQVENTITIRVPNTRLDTMLKQVAGMVSFLDHRTIKADDVGLQLLENRLTEKRMLTHEKRLTKAIDKQGKRLWETTVAEGSLLERLQTVDEARLKNLSLEDQINYSTVSLLIYQRPTVVHELVANEKNIKTYEPSFWLKLKESLYNGWEILEAVVLFFAKLWGLAILVAAIYLFIMFVIRLNAKLKLSSK